MMTKYNDIKSVLILLGIMYGVQCVSMLIPLNHMLGLETRTLMSLPNVFTMHFAHGGWAHLLSNTMPFFILSVLLVSLNKKLFYHTLYCGGTLGAFFLWCAVPNTLQVGASLWVYALAGSLFAYAYKTRRFVFMAVAVFVAWFFGTGLLQGVFNAAPQVSVLGHVCGFIGGILSGIMVSRSDKTLL